MHLVIKSPLQDKMEQESVSFENEGNVSLGYFLKEHADRVKVVQINGRLVEDWERFVGGDDDVVEVMVGAGPQALIPLIIMMVIQILMTVLMQLLAPKPPKRTASASQPSVGIAGVTNTIAPGTTKFRVYGIREVFGHIICSTVSLNTPINQDLFKRMSYSVVYFMGSGPIKNILNPKITGTDIADIPGTTYEIRLGTDDQEIFSGHENVHQVYTDGRQFGIPTKEDTSIKDPLIYTTRGPVDRATVFINFPSGIWGTRVSGSRAGTQHAGWYNFQVKYKVNGTEVWALYQDYHFTAQTQDGVFTQIVIDFPLKERYDISLQVTLTRTESQDSGPPVLFDVMETQFIRTSYPGNALLRISGVDSAQVNSLDAIECSALEHGALVPVWDADCQLFVKNFTQSRAFIIRDIMCNVQHGMGASFPERLMDDGSLIDAYMNYESDQVTGYGGLEDRDHCDVLLSDSKPGQDWVKALCFEGDTRLIPSRGKFKYIIDRGDALEMRTYGEPDGIIEGSVNVEFGRNDRPVNVIEGEFADETQHYKMIPCRLEKLGGLNGEQEIIEKASYISITRASQVERRMRRDVNTLNLIDEFYDWKAPKHALLNEVWDPIFLSFKTIDFFKGYSGIVGPGSTATVINLNQEVTLLTGLAYTMYFKSLRSKGVQQRTISTAAGTHTSVTVTAALTDVRQEDVWVIGVPDTHILKLKLEETKRDKDGTYDVKGSVIDPLVYRIDDPLLPITDGINTAVSETAPFQPIIVQVVGVGGNAVFKVAPGFDNYRGMSIDTTTTYVQLAAREPNVDGFFNGYGLEVGALGRKLIISSYDGASRTAFVPSDPGVLGPQPYRLSAPDPGRFAGYSVEHSPALAGPWAALSSTSGTTLSVGGYGSSTEFFRITPVSNRGTENTTGRWVIQLSAGDSIAPPAPISVTASQVLGRNVQVTTVISFPLQRDVWKVNVRLNEGAADGPTLALTTVDINLLRDEDNESGTKNVVATLDMSAQPDGTLVYARVNVEDYFGNVSTFVDTTVGVEIMPGENDDDLIPDTDAGDIVVTGTGETTVASMSVPGGSLGTTGMAFLEVFLRVTDTNSTNDARLTLRAKFKDVTLATLTCRTSDVVSNIDTDNIWRINLYLCVKNFVDELLVYLIKEGDETITDAPYPGNPVRFARGTSSGSIDVETTGTFELTAQWSTAATGLTATKEFSRQDFVVNV